MRRKGLFTSLIATRRKQRDRGSLRVLEAAPGRRRKTLRNATWNGSAPTTPAREEARALWVLDPDVGPDLDVWVSEQLAMIALRAQLAVFRLPPVPTIAHQTAGR